MLSELLSMKEAAGVLSCSEGAVRKWVHQRRFRVTKVGRLTKLRACDVQAIAKGEARFPAAGAHPRETD